MAKLTGANLQKLVNMVFSQPGKDDAVPFREFQDDNTKELSSFVQNLVEVGHRSSVTAAVPIPLEVTKRGLESAIEFAQDAITKRHLNPSMVKLALGIFLTHSSEAHRLGVVAPPLKEHSEFTSTKKPPLSNPITADTLQGVELLTYFREDYDFNDHHYHWHLVYPYSGVSEPGQKHRRVIDRQGELFLYMHSQMIARYNAELLSWGLNMTHPWSYDDLLEFGYTPVPGLRDTFGARPPFRGWFENHTPNLPDDQAPVSKKTMIKWRNSINKGIIDEVFYTKKGNESGKLLLTEENAMNWVGVVVEAENPELQEVSPGEYIDRDLYGSVHNNGHDKFAEIGYHEYTSDKNPLGMMSSNIGSPRDPCFWLWHTHIDDFRNSIVKKYNHSLGAFDPNVKIVELEIMPREKSTTPKGGLATFLGPPQLDHNEANAKINHEPYIWKVVVQSLRNPPPCKDNPQTFTVRIFITPKVLLQDHRSWIEMDKFTHTLTNLTDTLIRLDTQSSVARKTPKPGEKLGSRCLCGWPQNMMLPNGTPHGIEYVGFAILTDDKLIEGGTQAISFCGANDQKYPDHRGMGYPFNKTWSSRVNTTAAVPEIVAKLPQAKLCEFKIYRFTKLYQGDVSPSPTPSNITWENKIKDFFTARDIRCMKKAANINLGNKDSVILHAPAIYNQVEAGTMPLNEEKWSKQKVADFKAWMDAGTP